MTKEKKTDESTKESTVVKYAKSCGTGFITGGVKATYMTGGTATAAGAALGCVKSVAQKSVYEKVIKPMVKADRERAEKLVDSGGMWHPDRDLMATNVFLDRMNANFKRMKADKDRIETDKDTGGNNGGSDNCIIMKFTIEYNNIFIANNGLDGIKQAYEVGGIGGVNQILDYFES